MFCDSKCFIAYLKHNTTLLANIYTYSANIHTYSAEIFMFNETSSFKFHTTCANPFSLVKSHL